jgi:two-component system chemotaxis response regulator CheB
MDDPLKILVVDDSIVYRQIMSKIVTSIRDTELMGIASNGKIALARIELTPPDLVLMDMAMPEMDGFEALGHIRQRFPGVDVIIISGVDQKSANLTVKALESGAIDFVPKPRTTSPEQSLEELKTALAPLIQLARTRKYVRQARVGAPATKSAAPYARPQMDRMDRVDRMIIPVPATPIKPAFERRHRVTRFDVVALGVSTGGPNTLKAIIPQLSADFPLPILAVQHMPAMFTASLAESLDKAAAIRVVEGREGENVQKGCMYIAPGGCHMVVRKAGDRIVLGMNDSPPVNSCRPAVDVLFRSIGMLYGGNVLSVILTGMGNDGASGVAALRRKGAYSIVQDEKSSVIWGMPGAVAQAGDADEILPMDRIASRIMTLAQKGLC